MAERKRAIITGITDDGTQIALPGYATFIADSVDAAHSFDLAEIKDETNHDASLVATNGKLEVDITWTPSGATRAAAAATAVFLTPLASVALNHFKVTALNGTWIYVGNGSIKLSQSAAKMTLKVRKYDNSTQNTSLATTVTG